MAPKPEALEFMREAIAPWERWPDVVLEDIADPSSVVQIMVVTLPDGTRVKTDARVAHDVLLLRRILAAH